MTVFRILISIAISAGITALLGIAQVRRFSKITRHPWHDNYSHRWTLIVYVIVRVLAIFALVRALLLKSYESALYCGMALVLFEMPMWVCNRLKMEFSPLMEVIILLFIYAAEILGEVDSYYVLVPGWDTILHGINGFLCAAIGFCLVDMLNRTPGVALKLSPIYLTIVAFCFSMTIGVLWEFFEYAADTIFALDMQKDTLVQSFYTVFLDSSHSNIPVGISGITETVLTLADGSRITIPGGYLDIGIRDTMKDLIVNALGALGFSIVGYAAAKTGTTARLAHAFIPVVKKPGEIGQDKPANPSQPKDSQG